MITNRLNELSERAADRYSQLIMAWQGLFQTSANSSNFGTSQGAVKMSDEAYVTARQFLENEATQIALAVNEIVSEARTDVLSQLQSSDEQDETVVVSELVLQSQSYLAHELAIQIERDISLLKDTMRRMTIHVGMSAKIQNTSIRQALIQHRMINTEPVQFFFYARNSAKWPSRRFVRTLWRHTLLSVYNEIIMQALVDHNEFQAQVDHANVDFHAYGRIISLFDGSSLPTYLDVRNELFHPNSDAVLKRVA